MKHRIDPTVDCVWKSLLGTEHNKNLLIHFLNAVISPTPERRIEWVEILNPYNLQEFLTDKLSIVDVKARDRSGRLFQIELQLDVYHHLGPRMLYGFCDLYASQLASGKEYQALNPTIGIWLLGGTHFKTSDAFFHHFQLADLRDKELLEPQNGIYVVELSKWQKSQVEGELDRWTRFFRDGKDLDDAALPEYMDTSEMRQAMETLKMFSEKEREYHTYQARMNYLRQQRTIQLEREEERQQTEAARLQLEATRLQVEAARQQLEAEKQQVEAEKQRTEAAQRELARMKDLLRKAGIDPEKV